MSCDRYEVGTRLQAIADFRIEETLAAPVGASNHEIKSGDTGEVTQIRKAGSFHGMIVRWDHLNRTVNLDRDQFELVNPIPGPDSE